MKRSYKSIIWWVVSVLLMIVFVVYQRMTGPTYPVSGSITITNQPIQYKLLRTHETTADAPVRIIVKDRSLEGQLLYRLTPSYDTTYTEVGMKRSGDTLYAYIPQQTAAGKIAYTILLQSDDIQPVFVTEEPVVIRFKGAVPDYVLIPHIIFMFLAMVFSVRTGIEALRRGAKTFQLTKWTLLLLFLGGLILGPLVQKYAFDAYWTGWPFGHDLTDNKTLFSFIFWLIAFFTLWKNRQNRTWPIVASVVLLAVYLIPHSVLGSEIDYREIETIINPLLLLW
ncbi:MAG: hypothetical protein K9G67_05040 [Bacteroidales bacterium]|nr:hypothetical protein [Bacteroidales bacterium]MCF8344675.1 hypothetical protein [Bacteroidales bacterium]MCF8351477.1 hypothetical protein [Bacteroidales bacterium]MCF8375698.1 hypothetical protein [Bacteroidales bacterium]MCF8400298.1 hypothetical protein [Bacteroidales bacterium]